MDFNKFCETIAKKMGVELIPQLSRHDYAYNYIVCGSIKPSYEEYCKRRGIMKNGKWSIDFEDLSDGKHQSYHCEVYNAQTKWLFGYVDDYGDIKSSYYNRDDGKQEIYYEGTDLGEAVDFLQRHSDPVCVW